jgi:hypothetical protein
MAATPSIDLFDTSLFQTKPKKKKKLSKTRTKSTKKFCKIIQNTTRKSPANK